MQTVPGDDEVIIGTPGKLITTYLEAVFEQPFASVTFTEYVVADDGLTTIEVVAVCPVDHTISG